MSDDWKIKIGDEVRLMWPFLPNAEIRRLHGVVRGIPQATGDSWIIESPEYGGEVYYISEPVTISKSSPPKDKE